jgi:hypothetical protein
MNDDFTAAIGASGTGTTESIGGAFQKAFDSIIKYDTDPFGNQIRYAGVKEFIIIIVVAIALGLIMSLLYIKVTKKKPSTNFAISLIILPTVITAVVFLVGNNIAAAFSLSGVFSVTRFRSVAGNSKDITFIFVSMAIGLACGTGFVLYAVFVAIILAVVLLILNIAGYGEPKGEPKVLRINVPESISYGDMFEPIFQKYAESWDIRRVKLIDLGATYEVSYAIKVKEGINEKDFLDELRTRNGNLNIILVLDPRRDTRGEM